MYYLIKNKVTNLFCNVLKIYDDFDVLKETDNKSESIIYTHKEAMKAADVLQSQGYEIAINEYQKGKSFLKR